MKPDVFLRFPGTCEAAVRFYQSVFGGELVYLQRFKEMRENGIAVAPEDEEKIAFVALAVGGEIMLSADDYSRDSHALAGEYLAGNNITLQVRLSNRKEVDGIFAALSPGGSSIRPPQQAFWGEYFAHFKDKFGVWWNICYSAARPA
jgi:PhnB protein